MKREIKFRGKGINMADWFYGHYNEGQKDCHYITRPEGYVWQVEPESVGQFTGLKDKNGKEIYEGDIILSYDEKIVIEYDNDVAGFNISYNVSECVILPYEVEVIGNITRIQNY